MTDRTAVTDELLDEAAAWWARLARDEADGADWEAFSEWLEADSAHGLAYDRVCEAEDDLAARLSERAEPKLPPTEDDEEPAIPRRALWLTGLAIAASFILALFWPSSQSVEWQDYATGPGEILTIALDGGSSIALNRDTQIRLAEGDVRRVRLVSGEASFEIVDGAIAPFQVEAGGVRLVDQGTTFNVTRDAGWVRVGVSEGRVLVNYQRQHVSLGAGRQLALRDGSSDLIVTRDDSGAMNGWQDGRLFYRDAPIDLVAADLARNLGVEIAVADDLKDRHFTGVIQLDGGSQQTLSTAAVLFGVQLRRTSDGWRLVSG